MAFPQGIYFRVTDNQTDPADYDANTRTVYPQTTAQGNTVGWTDTSALGGADRTATNVILKGINYCSNGITRDFKISLPATGDYKVRLAAGDAAGSQGCKVELLDNTTSLSVLANQSSGGAARFIDATNVIRTSEADWIANNALSPAYTFATTTCIVRIGGFSTGGGNTTLAAFWIEAAAGGGGGGNPWYYRLQQAIASERRRIFLPARDIIIARAA